MEKVEFGFYQLSTSRYEPTIPDCQIQKWYKKVGDMVQKSEPLLQFEADKVGEIDLLSPFSGTIVSINERFLDSSDAEGRLWRHNPKLGNKEIAGIILHLPELGWMEIDDDLGDKPSAVEKPVPQAHGGRVRAAPAARKLARKQGIDINALQGTGPFGRVMRADVEQVVKGRQTKPELKPDTKPEPQQLDDRVPLNASQIRKTIAYFMEKSHKEIPKAGDAVTVDITHLWNFYKARRETWREDTGTDFSFTGIFMFLAMKLLHEQREKFSIINAYWDKDENDAYLFRRINIGIALQTPEGLMVPVIHSAETLPFREFMLQVSDKVQRAMTRKITLPELRDLTFTVNNVGAMGGENPDSIIPYTRESSGKERPTGMIMVLTAKLEDRATLRQFMKLAFSFDHRLFDGAPALEFVRVIRDYIHSKKSPDEFRELFRDDFSMKNPSP